MKYILIVIAFCCSVSALSAQEVYSSSGKSLTQVKKDRERKAKPHGFEPGRIIFGGGFGLGVGSVTNISVSPILGYRFSDKFSAGLGCGYQYIRAKEGSVVYDPATAAQIYKPITATCYYPNAWARYMIWRNVFAHAEYQHNFLTIKSYDNDHINYPYPIINTTTRVNEPTFWVGAGIRQAISDRVSFVPMLLYNVIPDKLNLYNGPIDIRLGINVGF
jgi:opacity protein-like surface antigen